MCCRVCLLYDLAELLSGMAAVDAGMAGMVSLPHYNLAPGMVAPVLLLQAEQRQLTPMRWGLAPTPRESRNTLLANARSETLHEKPAFRQLLGRRHALVPVSGYFEWQTDGRRRRPFLLQPVDGKWLLLAGLWNTGRNAAGCEIRSFAVITRAAGSDLAWLHPREPAMLNPAAAIAWLAGKPDALTDPRNTPLAWNELDGRINDVRHNDPACLAPARVGQPALPGLDA